MKKIMTMKAILIISIVAFLSGNVKAQFAGDYAPINWTFTQVNTPSDGYFDASGAPNTLILAGDDDGSGGCCDEHSSFGITICSAGTISFSYSHSNPDIDDAAYAINGVRTVFSNGGSGTVGPIAVNPGDFFEFQVVSYDDCCGRGILTITNFSGPSCCAGTTAPTVSPVLAQCASGSFALSASSPNPLSWFSTPNTALPPIATGSSYTTPTLTSTTSYYVAPYSVANSCFGSPVQVVCTIDQVDQISFFTVDTILCELSDPIIVPVSPSGGTLSGTGSTANGFDPSVGVGSYYLYYDLGDVCNSNDSLQIVVQGIIVAPSVGGCPGDSVSLTATGGPGINWFDDFNGSNVLDTGNVYTFLMDTAVSYYYATGSGVGGFYIDTIFDSNANISDHDAVTWDDRGGVAITQNWFYVVGDGFTGRIDPDLTTPWTALPIRDGIVSDLNSGQLYTLWNGTSDPMGTSLFGYVWTHLAPMDDMLAINSAGAIPLSQSITISGHGIMASGKSFMILWNNNDQTFYKVTYSTGVVEVLGTGTPNYFWSENWADWGVAEVLSNGDYAISYRSSMGAYIERFNITQGSTSIVADFTSTGGLSDLSSFTVSPWNNRFYFHFEGWSGTYGGSSETGGYSDATLVSTSGVQGCPVEVAVTVSPLPTVSLGGGTTICENNPITLDAGPGMASYDWSTGESTQTISTNYNGEISVTVTNSYGCTDADTVILTVLPIDDVYLGSDMTVCNMQVFSLNAGSGYFAYNWSNGQNTQVINVNASFLPLGDTTYIVEVGMANGCTDSDTITVTIVNCWGLEEISDSQIMIYPNPAADKTVMDLSSLSVEAERILLLDGFGRILMELKSTDQLVEIDVNDLSNGMYYVQVQTASGVINIDLSVQH